jgi:hypothetical protein
MIRQLSHRVALALALTTLTLIGMASPASADERRPVSSNFNTKRYASQRRDIDGVRKNGFPSLGSEYEVLAPGTSTYNCIAWSLGNTKEWVWPGNTVKAFDQLNGKYGYQKMSKMDFRLQPGVEKIVLYGKVVNGRTVATHQARQMADGTWTSKMGKMAVIRHAAPDSLDGPDYGHPVAVYSRKR